MRAAGGDQALGIGDKPRGEGEKMDAKKRKETIKTVVIAVLASVGGLLLLGFAMASLGLVNY